jgi:hypothetical protein
MVRHGNVTEGLHQVHSGKSSDTHTCLHALSSIGARCHGGSSTVAAQMHSSVQQHSVDSTDSEITPVPVLLMRHTTQSS